MERKLSDRFIDEVDRFNRVPFEIRIRHLEDIRLMVKYNVTPEKLIGKNVEYMTSIIKSPNTSSRIKSKKRDHIGDTPEQAEKYRINAVGFYEQFLELPLDYPVKIKIDEKDRKCYGCAFGEHCSSQSFLSKFYSHDKILMTEFYLLLDDLKMSDEIEEVNETVINSDGESKIVKSHLTTAGTIRRALESDSVWNFNFYIGKK